MIKVITKLFKRLRVNLEFILYISLGVFLFVLFFQPFPHSEFDFYNRLLFKAGLGAIVFLFLYLVRVLDSCLIRRASSLEEKIASFTYVHGFTFWVLCSVSFIFYLKYIGLISISSYVVFKAIVICAIPPVILLISDKTRKFRTENESLNSENRRLTNWVENCEEESQNRYIEFISGVNGLKVKFLHANILFMRSAGNYVEIHYIDKDRVEKALVRNTMKNILLQIEPYPNFLHCHRSFIVNTQFIDKQNGNGNRHKLIIEGYPKPIPVSLQHYLKVKEALSTY